MSDFASICWAWPYAPPLRAMQLHRLASARVCCILIDWRAGEKGPTSFPWEGPWFILFLPMWPVRCMKSERLTCKLGEDWGARERGPLYTEF